MLNKYALTTFAALGLTAVAYSSVPPMEVTVFDGSGNVAFKAPINASATFATRQLDAGNYVVQFNAKSAAVKGNHYLLVVSAGKAKVIAAAVPGEKFAAGGAAMKVKVGPGLRITGQVAPEQAGALARNAKYRVIGGRRYVWRAEMGSNVGGRWVEEGSAPSSNVSSLGRDQFRKEQDRAAEGSMLDGHSDPAQRPSRF